jgi:hypothetical protein
MCYLRIADLGISLVNQVAMWVVQDELLHTESCPSKVLFEEVQLTQLLPCLLIAHEPATHMCLLSVTHTKCQHKDKPQIIMDGCVCLETGLSWLRIQSSGELL